MAKFLSPFRFLLVALLSLFFMVILVFFPAGSFFWFEGWLFVVVMFFYVLVAGGWLLGNAPGLAKKRVSFRSSSFGWDKAITGFLGVFVLAEIAVAGLDAVRFKLTVMPVVFEAIGFVGFVAGLSLYFLAMKENAFAARIVELQKNQKVVTTGPYAKIRHRKPVKTLDSNNRQ